MNKLQRTLLVGVSVLTLGVTGLSIGASASALSGDTDGQASLIDKIASTFNIDKTKLQEVFKADREERMAEMKTERAGALKSALDEGKLTQEQYDHIVSKQNEIDSMMGSLEDQTSEQRQAIRDKMGELRDWFEEQNLDVRDLGIGFGRGHGGPGGPRGMDSEKD